MIRFSVLAVLGQVAFFFTDETCEFLVGEIYSIYSIVKSDLQ